MSNRLRTALLTAALAGTALLTPLPPPARAEDPGAVKETRLDALGGVAVRVRMEGPYTADVPLQVVCYFKYTPEGAKRLAGAPVELDKRLGGAIGSLRERGEFTGDELETFLLTPKEGGIKAKALLLVGLGDEAKLTLGTMERVGRAAAREAARLGVSKAAFAPLIKDAGNDAFPAGDIEAAVTRGVLLALDTDRRLQKEGLSKAHTLDEWWVEAGPKYFDETVAGVKAGIADAAASAKGRGDRPYLSAPAK